MTEKTRTVLIGGEAGQGLVTVGQLLTKVLVRAGWHVCVTQGYQSRVRGGHNTWAIRFGVGELGAPGETVDLLVALDQETVELHRGALTPRGLLIADETIDPLGTSGLRVPYAKLASARHANVAALGVAGTLLGLTEELMAGAVEELFGKKVFKRDKPQKWVCSNCGYVHEGPEAPDQCPACAHPREYYEVLCENW